MQPAESNQGPTPGQLLRWIAAGLFLLGALSLIAKQGVGLAGLLFGLIFLAITGTLVHFLAKGLDALSLQRHRERNEIAARKGLCQERDWLYRPIPGQDLRWRVQPRDPTQGWQLDFHVRLGVLPAQNVHQLGFSLRQSGSFPPLLLLHRRGVEALAKDSRLPVAQIDWITRYDGDSQGLAQIRQLARQRPSWLGAGPADYAWLALDPELAPKLSQDAQLNALLRQVDADLEPLYAMAQANSSGLFLYAGADGLEFNGLTAFMSAAMIEQVMQIRKQLYIQLL